MTNEFASTQNNLYLNFTLIQIKTKRKQIIITKRVKKYYLN